MIVITFAITSITHKDGSIHQLVVNESESVGAKSETQIKSWTTSVPTITCTLKDDGILYVDGSGTFPTYSSIDSTPWADYKGKIVGVKVNSNITVNGKIPIK